MRALPEILDDISFPNDSRSSSEHLDIEVFYKTHDPTLNQLASHFIMGFKPGNEPEEWPASEGRLPSRISQILHM